MSNTNFSSKKRSTAGSRKSWLNSVRIWLAETIVAVTSRGDAYARILYERAKSDAPLSWKFVGLAVFAIALIIFITIWPNWLKAEPRTYRGVFQCQESRIALLVKPVALPVKYFFPEREAWA